MATKELALFLAHATEVESESQERYQELADILKQHHNAPVAEFFQQMAVEAQHHASEVEELASGMELPQLQAWEYEWLELEAPETARYEAVHYLMSLRDAVSLAMENEQSAHDFYHHIAESATDQEAVRLAGLFAEEELSHLAELEKQLAELPADTAHRREEDDEPHMPE